jgi:hypothetical protein
MSTTLITSSTENMDRVRNRNPVQLRLPASTTTSPETFDSNIAIAMSIGDGSLRAMNKVSEEGFRRRFQKKAPAVRNPPGQQPTQLMSDEGPEPPLHPTISQDFLLIVKTREHLSHIRTIDSGASGEVHEVPPQRCRNKTISICANPQ